MSRFVPIFLLALFLVQPGTLFPVELEIMEVVFSTISNEADHDERCDEPCPSDNENGQCPSNCQFCVCCSSLRTVIPVVLTGVSVPMVWQAFPLSVLQKLPSVDPHDVFHVPKQLFA